MQCFCVPNMRVRKCVLLYCMLLFKTHFNFYNVVYTPQYISMHDVLIHILYILYVHYIDLYTVYTPVPFAWFLMAWSSNLGDQTPKGFSPIKLRMLQKRYVHEMLFNFRRKEYEKMIRHWQYYYPKVFWYDSLNPATSHAWLYFTSDKLTIWT